MRIFLKHLLIIKKGDVQARTVADHLSNEDCTGGSWAYVDMDLTKYDGKAIKLNITMPQLVLQP
ncbi:type II toxin-antitoxin system HicB family antitoxin [Photorhabdus sp. CRCIA-P01]|uniref:type II toxin-antitoxin system HicB family antitoxin n=1 Tax=Photorhabdus sp. CRCIA-P01 TaxID=2019570 RepID=UPI001E2E481E|nr:type II toxin-antitoxin system HicB family antitoxin [Photorhabdus sp. CRCIA-P01]